MSAYEVSAARELDDLRWLPEYLSDSQKLRNELINETMAAVKSLHWRPGSARPRPRHDLMSASDRVCVVCGAGLSGQRSDAVRSSGPAPPEDKE